MKKIKYILSFIILGVLILNFDLSAKPMNFRDALRGLPPASFLIKQKAKALEYSKLKQNKRKQTAPWVDGSDLTATHGYSVGESAKVRMVNWKTYDYEDITIKCIKVDNDTVNTGKPLIYFFAQDSELVQNPNDDVFYNQLKTEMYANFQTNIYEKTTSLFGDRFRFDSSTPPARLTTPIPIYVILVSMKHGDSSYTNGYFDPGEKARLGVNLIFVDGAYHKNKTTSEVMATLSHEFQHLIHNTFDPDEEVWLDEAFAMLAMYNCGYSLQPLFYDYLKYYFIALIRSDSDWGATDYLLSDGFPTQGDYASGINSRLINYGQGMAFAIYLYDRFNRSGTPLIKNIVANSNNGVRGIEDVLPSGRTMSTIFLDFAIALYIDLDSTTVGNGAYKFTSFGSGQTASASDVGYKASVENMKVTPDIEETSLFKQTTSISLIDWSFKYINIKSIKGGSVTFRFDGKDNNPDLSLGVIQFDASDSVKSVEKYVLNQSDNIKELTIEGAYRIVVVPVLTTNYTSTYDAQAGKNLFTPPLNTRVNSSYKLLSMYLGIVPLPVSKTTAGKMNKVVFLTDTKTYVRSCSLVLGTSKEDMERSSNNSNIFYKTKNISSYTGNVAVKVEATTNNGLNLTGQKTYAAAIMRPNSRKILEAPGDFVLNIPEGAVKEDTHIACFSGELDLKLPSNINIVSAPLSINPGGIVFEKDILLNYKNISENKTVGLFLAKNETEAEFKSIYDKASSNTKINSTGTYFLATENIPPELNLIESGIENNKNFLKFSISDNFSGLNLESLKIKYDTNDITDFYFEENFLKVYIETPKKDAVLDIQIADNLNNISRMNKKVSLAPAYNFVESYVYPNPATGNNIKLRCSVNNPVLTSIDFKIYDSSGELVKNFNINNFIVTGNNYDCTWDLKNQSGFDLSNGVYFYKASVNDGTTGFSKTGKIAILR